MFSGHGITETRITDNFWFTAGYSYTTITNDLSGSRIFGTHWDEAFGEPVPTLGSRDHAFIDLAGTARIRENVFNANLFWMPFESLAILTGFRYTHENNDSDSTFLEEEPVPNTPPFTPLNPAGGFHFGPPIPAEGARNSDYNRFAERLELRYTGIKDWLFYFEGEWEEEFGNVDEFQNVDEEIPLDKDTNALGQKYTVGATWYPTMRLNFAGQYFHRIASYDEDVFSAQFPRLINQDWNVDDFNIRMTFRPKLPACMGTLALVTRYDFVHTSIDSQWGIFPQDDLLAELQSGEIKKHVISESLNWNPLPRFFLQANFSYVLNQTDTPANDINLDPLTSPTVVNFRNDYWTVTSGIGYIIDDKTDFYADYYFYCANDYFKNAAVAMPYGMGATEHAVSATVTRKLSKNMRLLLKYGYFNYRDVTSGRSQQLPGALTLFESSNSILSACEPQHCHESALSTPSGSWFSKSRSDSIFQYAAKYLPRCLRLQVQHSRYPSGVISRTGSVGPAWCWRPRRYSLLFFSSRSISSLPQRIRTLESSHCAHREAIPGQLDGDSAIGHN